MEILAGPGPQGNQGISRKFFRDAFSVFILDSDSEAPLKCLSFQKDTDRVTDI